jgi:hypothetical protein
LARRPPIFGVDSVLLSASLAAEHTMFGLLPQILVARHLARTRFRLRQ